mgnify:CR=1 FL=1
MTTTVTVKAWHGSPVRVTTIDQYEDGPVTETVHELAPGYQHDFHATDSRKILVEELPKTADAG